jgi:hypothetical protein
MRPVGKPSVDTERHRIIGYSGTGVLLQLFVEPSLSSELQFPELVLLAANLGTALLPSDLRRGQDADSGMRALFYREIG